MTDPKPVHVTALEVANFKRLVALSLTLTPDGRLTIIGGANGAGKSSALDAVWAALEGAKAVPGVAVRKGETKGHAQVTLDNGLTIRRSFTETGGGTLTVTDGEGRRYQSPQGVLDALYGALSFDPLAFTRMTAREQGETLRRATGLDLSDLDADRKLAYDERTVANRIAKAAADKAAGLPAVDAPDDEVSIAHVAEELRAAEEANRGNARTRKVAVDAAWEKARANEAEAAAEAVLAEAVKALDAAKAATVAAAGRWQAAEAVAKDAIDVDTAPIAARLNEAEAVNAKVRAKRARATADFDAARLKGEADALTICIGAIDANRVKRIGAAALPVPGLGFDGEGNVSLNDLPFEQASQAEQLRVSLAMGAALNPALRLIIVKDGSLLDAISLAIVAEFARANDLQILMERVGEGPEVGVVIEAGEVKEDRRETGADPLDGAIPGEQGKLGL